MPAGATLERTEAVIAQNVRHRLNRQPGVANAVQFPGLSVNGFVNSSSAGIVFVPLDEFENRTTPDLAAGAIAGKLQAEFNKIDEAFIAIFPPPPVRGLGTTGGFKLQIQDRVPISASRRWMMP